jgi:peptidoglycan/xylan/chitin deacetylase (PgdA/CDA1 family)
MYTRGNGYDYCSASPKRSPAMSGKRILMSFTPVLMYHAVGQPLDKAFRPWVVSPSLLAEQLAALAESGYEFVGMTEWASRQEQEKCAVLTFDDGYTDFIENALPILTTRRARATAYIVTGYVGKRARWLPFELERQRPLMGWEDLQAIKQSGIEIGSHGHRHLELDAVPPGIANDDVSQSLAALRENGFSPQSFCYPFGYASRRTREIIARAGFSTSCIVGRGLAEPDGDLLCVRRLFVDHRTSPEALMHRVNGPAFPPAARLRAAAQPTWRLIRRARIGTRSAMKARVTHSE